MTHAILIGPVEAAFRYAKEVWRTLPRPSAEEAEALREVFAAVGSGPLPVSFDPAEATLRRPHCTACYTGIFGGGASHYPGELALARHGVLLLAEVNHFTPEIAEALVAHLATPPRGSPVILLHATSSDVVPQALAGLPLARVEVG